MDNRKHSKGVTLLETILVLAIAIMIITLSLRLLRLYNYRASISRLNQAVELSFLLGNEYYYANCRSYNTSQLLATDFSTLTSWAGSLSPQEILTIQNLPLAGTFSFSITDIRAQGATKPLYNFVLSATFPSTLPAEKLTMLQGELNADQIINGNTLRWTRLPGIFASENSEKFWVSSSFLQYKSANAQIILNQKAPCPL